MPHRQHEDFAWQYRNPKNYAFIIRGIIGLQRAARGLVPRRKVLIRRLWVRSLIGCAYRIRRNRNLQFKRSTSEFSLGWITKWNHVPPRSDGTTYLGTPKIRNIWKSRSYSSVDPEFLSIFSRQGKTVFSKMSGLLDKFRNRQAIPVCKIEIMKKEKFEESVLRGQVDKLEIKRSLNFVIRGPSRMSTYISEDIPLKIPSFPRNLYKIPNVTRRRSTWAKHIRRALPISLRSDYSQRVINIHSCG